MKSQFYISLVNWENFESTAFGQNLKIKIFYISLSYFGKNWEVYHGTILKYSEVQSLCEMDKEKCSLKHIRA